MAEVLLFHHAQGLTGGVRAFAGDLEAAGHVVHVPDLYDGATFGDLDAGVAHAQATGFGEIVARGQAAADGLPDALVLMGMSLGVMPAQAIAQTRAGTRGAVLLHGCVAPKYFGDGWPAGLPAQIHIAQDDAQMQGDLGEDLADARALAAAHDAVELFLYPGDAHLFTDASLPAHDRPAAALVRERVLAFLETLA